MPDQILQEGRADGLVPAIGSCAEPDRRNLARGQPCLDHAHQGGLACSPATEDTYDEGSLGLGVQDDLLKRQCIRRESQTIDLGGTIVEQRAGSDTSVILEIGLYDRSPSSTSRCHVTVILPIAVEQKKDK
ncbi:hypothetical protein U1701_17285 [Sphingomonas sp. PB2P19]|uniref:hypothetical protein n=1 Tax=Sphingomonas rhamnosi TaxID=3096156 RepID=UPI002FC99D96